MTTAVVGAGMSGLVRARALAASGEEVVLFEGSKRPGGVVRSEKRAGYLLELGPNTVRPTPELWSLVGELGLESEVLLADPRIPRYIDYGGRLHPLPASPIGLARTRLLSPRGKLRLLAEPFARRGRSSAETVHDFVTRRLGREVADRIVEPFVSGIWGGRADRLSAAEAFPTLVRWESAAGSLLLGALASLRGGSRARIRPPRGLLSFRDGMETLPGCLAADLGPRARFGTPVESIRPRGRVWTVSTGGEEREVERVCVATPAREAARLVAGFAPEAAQALASIPYAPLAILHGAADERAARRGFGHLVVPQQSRRILGAVWSSSVFPGRAPRGRSLFTVFLGGARDPEALDLTDTELFDVASRDLGAALGVAPQFEAISLTRYRGAIPQYDTSHRDRMASLSAAEKRFPGLVFLGSYRGGVSVGDVVRSALAV